MYKHLLFACFFSFSVSAEEVHPFKGKHFLASYKGCDVQAMRDDQKLLQAMDKAVEASGASVLDRAHYIFDPEGITVIYLLAESHASLHTYPEHQACFIDLFTCGEIGLPEAFDQALQKYLKPSQAHCQLLNRD